MSQFTIKIHGGTGPVISGNYNTLNIGTFPTDNNVNDHRHLPPIIREGPIQETMPQNDAREDNKYVIKKGFALIINNEYFSKSPDRAPFRVDVNDIHNFCVHSNLAIDEVTRQTENLTAKEIWNLCSEVSKWDFQEYDALVCFIMSHGNESGILGTDDKHVSIDEIVTMFQKTRSLVGKPKLFFIQACRGKNTDCSMQADNPVHFQQYEPSLLPTAADTLIANACAQGFRSCGIPGQGTLFIQALIDELGLHAHHDHLINILVRVNKRIAGIDDSTNRKQMPCQISTLTKLVYFTFPPPLDNPA